MSSRTRWDHICINYEIFSYHKKGKISESYFKSVKMWYQNIIVLQYTLIRSKYSMKRFVFFFSKVWKPGMRECCIYDCKNDNIIIYKCHEREYIWHYFYATSKIKEINECFFFVFFLYFRKQTGRGFFWSPKTWQRTV